LFFSYAVYPCLSVAGAGAGAGTGVAVWPKRDAKGVAAGDATAAAPPPGPNKSSMSSIAFCLFGGAEGASPELVGAPPKI